MSNAIAQQVPCFFDEYANNDQLRPRELQIVRGVENFNRQPRSTPGVKVIPIVVHVIHDGGSENISEAQIQSQIQVLNEDYGKIAGSRGDGLGVDTGVRFFLANFTPDGKCTNGIVRVRSPITNHQTYQRPLLKELSYWDNERYLNIYVVKKINGNVSGYSSFPGGPPDEDGVVVSHNYFGTIGTASRSLGRTTSHELGHWFGLYHTFNNACGEDTCSDGDYVCDTPPAMVPNYSCTVRNTCHNDVPDENDLKENYMDYTPDACKNMFTEGQKMRIQGTLHEIRSTIWSEENLFDIGYDSLIVPMEDCPVVADFVALTPDICIGNTVHFMDKSLNHAISWQWSFPGGNPGFSNDQNPVVIYDSLGIFEVKLIVSGDDRKDSLILESYIQVGLPGIGDSLPYSEDFDDGLYPPQGMVIYNPDAETTWELDSLGFKSGKYSMRINNLVNTNYGTIDEIILPDLNFTNSSTASMSFSWAYAKSDPNFSDELLVLLSTDCGTNFTEVFYRTGGGLATGPTQTTLFIPDSSQWKNALINLDEYTDQGFVQIKIVNVTDGGNSLYIDDLQIKNDSDMVTSLVNGETSENLTIYPNPTSDRLNISIQLIKSEEIHVKLFNPQGVQVQEVRKERSGPGKHHLILPTNGLPAGLYFVVLQTGRYRSAVKVFVSHP